MKKTAVQLLTLALMTLLALPALAQDKPAPSPLGKVYQRVGVTDVEITYSRPGVKDRSIFGADGLVPFDKLWRTGANAATKISFSTDVKINGNPLPAGEYAIVSIPGQEKWTLIFNKDANMRGTGNYDEAQDALRIEVAPQEFPLPVETMTFVIGDVTDTSANVYLIWEKTSVPFTIEVEKTWE